MKTRPSDPWASSDSDDRFDLRVMSQGEWEYIVVEGDPPETFAGPFKFVSDGAIGAYPRFVSDTGLTVPWHSVRYGRRKR